MVICDTILSLRKLLIVILIFHLIFFLIQRLGPHKQESKYRNGIYVIDSSRHFTDYKQLLSFSSHSFSLSNRLKINFLITLALLTSFLTSHRKLSKGEDQRNINKNQYRQQGINLSGVLLGYHDTAYQGSILNLFPTELLVIVYLPAHDARTTLQPSIFKVLKSFQHP